MHKPNHRSIAALCTLTDKKVSDVVEENMILKYQSAHFSLEAFPSRCAPSAFTLFLYADDEGLDKASDEFIASLKLEAIAIARRLKR